MKEEVISIDDVISVLKRRKWSLILSIFLVFSLAAIAAFTIPETYRSESTILIEDQGIPQDLVASMVTGFADQRLQMINQRVMSSTRLLDIINRFNLYPELRNVLTTEEIISRMREDITFKTISADVVDQRTGRPSAAIIAFSLSYDGRDPVLVQKIAGLLTSFYLEENLKVREQQTTGTFKFLEDEAASLKNQLSKIDADMSEFKKRNMDSLPELMGSNLQGLDRTERDIIQLNDLLRTLKEKESYIQTQLSTIPTESDNQDKNLLRELKAKLVQLESRYSEKYPDVIKTRSEIAQLEERLGYSSGAAATTSQPDNPAYVTLASQLAGIRSEISSVKRQLEAQTKVRDEYQRRIEVFPKIDEAYKTIALERNNIQTKYDDLMKKAMEAKVSQGLEKGQMGERFNLIDPAKLPEKPIKPNKPAILLIGLILGIGAGVGVASLKEYSDHSIRSAKALARETALPVLASIPEIVTWKDRKRIRIRRILIFLGIVLLIAAAIAAFHFYIMDLDVFWAKVLRQWRKWFPA